MKALVKTIVTQAVKAAVFADYVRQHGHPPLNNAAFDEHTAKWLRAQGEGIKSKVKKSLAKLPTTLK